MVWWVGEKLQDQMVAQWLGLATIQQAQDMAA
jgi:hypothetical protein